MVENAIKPAKKKYVNMDIEYPRANKMLILLQDVSVIVLFFSS